MKLHIFFDDEQTPLSSGEEFLEMPTIPRIGETIYLEKPSYLSEDLKKFDCDEEVNGGGLAFKVNDIAYSFNTDNEVDDIQIYLELTS